MTLQEVLEIADTKEVSNLEAGKSQKR